VDRVWRAFVSLPARDLYVARVLMAVRALPQRLLRLPVPDLDSGTFLEASPVPVLEMETDRYALAGGVGRPWGGGGSPTTVATARALRDFEEPGCAKIATSFEFHTVGGRTLVTTETRVATTDPRSRRRMRAYWLLIRPFSGLIRRELLHRVEQRARRAAPTAVGRHS